MSTYVENPIMVALVRQMINSGTIQMPEDSMEPIDTEGREVRASCVCKEKEYEVILVAMAGKSYEQQAAEQICRAMYYEKRK